MIRSALICAVLLAFTGSAWSATQPAAGKTPKKAQKRVAQKAPAKPSAKPIKASKKPQPKASTRKTHKPGRLVQKGAPPRSIQKTSLNRDLARARAAAPVPHGKTEILTCRDGPEDRHARIGVVLVGGKTDSFAYYSKWKPRTCSIHLQRARDPYSRWTDQGNLTNVNLERGRLQIEHGKGEIRFVFRDIDRERYCGMEGTINGTLTIRKGSERCVVSGIMEEGTPLGQAQTYVQLEQSTALATLPAQSPSEPPPVRYAAQPTPIASARSAPARSSPRELAIPRSAD